MIQCLFALNQHHFNIDAVIMVATLGIKKLNANYLASDRLICLS